MDKANELSESRVEKYICIALFVVAVIIAAWLRFDQIGLKPFHHDEGVNSYFLMNLAAPGGQYKYDWRNYHGPTLYYFALAAVRIFGETDLALRLSPAVFGLLTVAMVWLLRRHLGRFGMAVAAICLALSRLVYYSRDFIHEMSFGCFSLGIVVGAWRYAESKKFMWLALMAVSAGLLVTTKETAIINLAVMLIAILAAAIWDTAKKLIRERRLTPATFVKELKSDVGAILPSLDHALAAIIIFVFIYVFFYSSVFTNKQGVTDYLKSITHWTRERSNKDHVKSFGYYFGILLKLELPLLAGSLLAGLLIVWRGTRFWLFTAAWTLGTALAYSVIGYKTPWLMISFVIPMALVCGYAAEQFYQFLPTIPLRVLGTALIVIALVPCGWMAWKVNFEKYDDNGNETGYFTRLGKKLELKPYMDGQYGYVYAQTDRGLLGLVEAVKNEAGKLPTGEDTGIYVAAPEYWPLPWYLRDYDKTAYTGNWPAAMGEKPNISQPIVIANVNQQAYLDGVPGWRVASPAYNMRPGVELIIFVRDENAQP